MATLQPQFQEAKQNVEPPEDDKKNAALAHQEVREFLESDQILLEYGIGAVLIGSYSRHVSIRRMKDVDVFSKLPDLPDDIEPLTLLGTFYSVLSSELGGDRVERQSRSVKVDFPDFDLSVDVVPARPKDNHWEIPNREDRGGGWEETNPERLGELSAEMNDKHNKLYVPIVKLIRQAGRAHVEQPGGLYLEILTFHTFDEMTEATASLSEGFCSALEGVAEQIKTAADAGLLDPTLPGCIISTRATRGDFETAIEMLHELALKANDALADEDKCQAAKAFREVLGKNSDGEYVFPMPEDCSDDGKKLIAPAIVAGDKHVPKGDRRFA